MASIFTLNLDAAATLVEAKRQVPLDTIVRERMGLLLATTSEIPTVSSRRPSVVMVGSCHPAAL
jgi:hypothetical protein